MPRKQKASVAWAKGLRVAQEATLSAKRLRLTPEICNVFPPFHGRL